LIDDQSTPPEKTMKETVDPQIIEQLDPIARKYEEAVNNNDAAAVAALFTEDAVFVADTGPIYGR
jgi:ketosteroid isomerase-like protein